MVSNDQRTTHWPKVGRLFLFILAHARTITEGKVHPANEMPEPQKEARNLTPSAWDV